MSRERIYLDYNASAPLCAEARAAMCAAMDLTGNPSSVHGEGRKARAAVEEARVAVAALVGARPSEVVFTSGAAEANAWAIGAGGWTSVVASAIEHDSVLAAIRAGAADHVAVPATRDGVVDLAALEALLRDSGPPARTLLTLQTANNETGVLQPVAEASAIARAHGVRVHTDAVQAAGRVAIDWQGSGVDALSLSAHKLGGPKGVGALVLSERLALRALIPGSQERRRRGGTENVVGICGFGAAARAALADLADAPRIAGLRDRLEAGVIEARPGTEVIGRSVPRLPNTSLIACPGERAETAVIRLDLAGLSVSAGAACSSGKVGASHVLAAMGLPPELARAAVRVSLGPATTTADVAAFIAAWMSLQATGGTRHVASPAAAEPTKDMALGAR